MIEKFINIQNIGKFHNYAASGDVVLRKLSLIYGENAQGKTTITSILRSLKTGDPSPILERHTLGVALPSHTELRLTGNTVIIFNNDAWSDILKEIEIFDSHFVERNIYSGERIDISHKRNLFEFVISQEAVDLAQQASQCDNIIDELNKELSTCRSALQQHIIGEISISVFVNLLEEEDIDSAIEKAQKQFDACTEAETIRQTTKLSDPPFDISMIDDLPQLLLESIDEISQDAVSSLDEHVRRCMDENGEPWIKQGINYISNDICPFCGQDLQDMTLIETYSQYFSEAYENLQDRLQNALDSIELQLSDGQLLLLQTSIQENDIALGYWQKYVVSSETPSFDTSELIKIVVETRDTILPLLQQKVAKPISVIAVDESVDENIAKLKKVNAELNEYRDSINEYNNLIDIVKEEIDVLSMYDAEEELKRIKNIQVRYRIDVKDVVKIYKEFQNKKVQEEENKGKIKEELDAVVRGVLMSLQEVINRLLGNFGADFKIVELERSYIGRTANAEYAIEILGQQVPVDSQSTPSPSFKNALSSGDKTTLAFAFFIASLKQDPDLQNKIVIIDDPISSLDDFRALHTSHAISDLVDEVEQVIVLSHYQTFLNRLNIQSQGKPIKCLSLVRAGAGSDVVEWDIEEACCGDYVADFRVLKRYLDNGTSGRLEDIARCIRPLLEGNLRARYPGEFEPNEWLGDFIRKITAAGSADTLARAKSQLTELSQIKDYSKQFHHDKNPTGFNTARTSDTELKPYVRRALAIIPGA